MVSIVMPCHNGAKYIKESVQSVLSQTYEDFELLIIEDNSTDNSVELVNTLKEKDSRIKLLINETPVGKPYMPRNIGIQSAKGRFIAFLDCDDKWLPDKLEKQLPLFEEENCAIVFSEYKKMDAESNEHDKIISAQSTVNFTQLLNGNCIGNLTAIYDTTKVGKVYQKDIHHEDYVMWLEILQRGFIAKNTKTVEAVYREHGTSVSSDKKKALLWTWNIYRKELKLDVFNSFFHFFIYAIKGVIKFLK